jgi:type IV secretory pathway TraG/TraD family ATPase VirD4
MRCTARRALHGATRSMASAQRETNTMRNTTTGLYQQEELTEPRGRDLARLAVGFFACLAFALLAATFSFARSTRFNSHLFGAGVPEVAYQQAFSLLWPALGGAALLALTGAFWTGLTAYRRRRLIGAALSLGLAAGSLWAYTQPVIYPPYAILFWAYQFYDEAALRPLLVEAAWASAGAFLYSACAIYLLAGGPRPWRLSDAFGSARWGDASWLVKGPPAKGYPWRRRLRDVVDMASLRPLLAFVPEVPPREHQPDGFPIGIRGGRIRFDVSGVHQLVCAPTRSGKGVGFAVPAMLTHKGSVVAVDIKRELWHVTARRRAELSRGRVFRFDPFGEETARYNPMRVIATSGPGLRHSADNAMMLAEMCILTTGQETNPFFVQSARQLLAGLILAQAFASDEWETQHRNVSPKDISPGNARPEKSRSVGDRPDAHLPDANRSNDVGLGIYAPETGRARRIHLGAKGPAHVETISGGTTSYGEAASEQSSTNRNGPARGPDAEQPPRTLPAVRRVLMQRDNALREHLCAMADHVNPTVSGIGAQFADMVGKTFSSVVSTARQETYFLGSPVMERALGATDLAFSALKTQPTSAFLIVPARHLETYRRWIRLMIACAQSEIMRASRPGGSPVLFLLDEFPRLGRLDRIEEGVSLHAGSGIQYVIITQTPQQLEALYGKLAASFTANMQNQIFWAANDPDVAEKISRMSGRRTIAARSASGSRAKDFADATGKTSVSETVSEQGRPLVTPSEAQQLPSDYSFVFTRGRPPVVMKRVNYLRDGFFLGMHDPHPEHDTAEAVQAAARRRAERITRPE